MSLFERFMGHSTVPYDPNLIANPAIEEPISLQVLFPGLLDLDGDALAQVIRSFHPHLHRARAEVMQIGEDPRDDQIENPPFLIGLVGWGPHVIKLVGFQSPAPTSFLENSIRPAHFSEELKADARNHQSHILLYYAGTDPDAFEQYVALTVVASALARFDALVVLNESARSAFPAEALLADEPGLDFFEAIRNLPIPLFFGGFVKFEVEQEDGVWMRTFGNRLLGLPDFAYRAKSHDEGNAIFDLYSNILSYLRESGSQFANGHTLQVGENEVLRLREKLESEWYLYQDGELFVLEEYHENEEDNSLPMSGC
jgi:hypothetical protein